MNIYINIYVIMRATIPIYHKNIIDDDIFVILSAAFFPYDGYYSETDRTGTVRKTIPSSQRPPPTIITMMYIPTPIMAITCLYKSALLVAELDSCLHP